MMKRTRFRRRGREGRVGSCRVARAAYRRKPLIAAGIGACCAMWACNPLRARREWQDRGAPCVGVHPMREVLMRRARVALNIVPAHGIETAGSVRPPALKFDADFATTALDENGGEPLCVKVCVSTEAGAAPQGALRRENIAFGFGQDRRGAVPCIRDTGCRYCYMTRPYEAIELTWRGWRQPARVRAGWTSATVRRMREVCVSLKAGVSIVSGAQERALSSSS